MEEEKLKIAASAKRTALLRLGNRLRRARERSRTTQVHTAEILEVTPQTVRNWETGRNEPPDSAIRKMADLYGLTLERLLEDLDTVVIPVRPRWGSRYNRVIVDPGKMSEARRNAGLKLSEVSDLTGLGPSTISRYERGQGNPGALTLEVLAGIYGKPPEWFTPEGHFTDKDRERFEESLKPWWDRKESVDTTADDAVMDTYDIASHHLSEESKLQIAKFILFMEARDLSLYGDDLPSAGYPKAAYVAALKSRMDLSELL